jgi:hypothetical protein
LFGVFDVLSPAGAASSNAPPGQLAAASGRGNGSSKAMGSLNSQPRSAGTFESDKERLLQLQQQLLGAQAELRSARCVKSAADLDCLVLTEDVCVSQRMAYPERVLQSLHVHTCSKQHGVWCVQIRQVFLLSSAAYPAALLRGMQSTSLQSPALSVDFQMVCYDRQHREVAYVEMSRLSSQLEAARAAAAAALGQAGQAEAAANARLEATLRKQVQVRRRLQFLNCGDIALLRKFH